MDLDSHARPAHLAGMRYALTASLALSLSVIGAASAAGDSELELTVRAASRFEAIARTCPTLIPTDVQRARAYAAAYIKAAGRFDAKKTTDLMPQEMIRRVADAQIAGELNWCEEQRQYLYKMGAGEVFPTARRR